MDSLKIDELKSKYETQWRTKETIEDKAKNVISTSATITSLIFGFVTFSTSFFKFGFPFSLSIVLVGSVIASIAAILISTAALRLQTYKALIEVNKLKNNAFKDSLVVAEDAQLIAGVVKGYISCIIFNDELNRQKAKGGTIWDISSVYKYCTYWYRY